jgi:transposase
MNQGKFVFSQIAAFLPQRAFDTIVEKYEGDYRVRHFGCWNQMLCMMFGQLSNRDSLSDLVLTINAHPSKAYHLGFGKGVSKANLGKSNANRCYKIFEDFAGHIIDEARKICLEEDPTEFSFSSSVYAFDSTTIDLCLNVFWWAKFRKTKGAIKLHTQYDIRTSIPVFIYFTAGSVNDVNAMDKISYEPGSFYVFDRGYLDFERLYVIEQSNSYFVIRARKNLRFKRQQSFPIDKSNGILCDQIGKLTVVNSLKGYPVKIRRIKFHDNDLNKTFIFLTNNMDLPAIEIASLYKHRWDVEIFFKWIKQHLKIKSFWGTTENAVKVQVYIAVITYTLVAIIRQKLKSKYSPYEVLQILGSSLLDKTPIKQLLNKTNDQDVKELYCNQLNIW